MKTHPKTKPAKRALGKPLSARMAKPAGAPMPRQARLIEWVEKQLRMEGSAIKPRVVVVTEREARAWPLPAPCGPFGFDGLLQAAAVAARTAAEEDWVGFMIKGAIHIRGGRRPGQTGQLDAMALAASTVEQHGWLYLGERDRSGWSLTRKPMELMEVGRYAAFRDPDYVVNPDIEQVLAEHGWPGAVAPETSVRDVLSPGSASGRDGPLAEVRPELPLDGAPVVQPPDVAGEDEAAEVVLHWSEARANAAELLALHPVGWNALRRTPLGRLPPTARTRSLEDLIASASSEVDMLDAVAYRIGRDADWRQALTSALGLGLPPVVAAFANLAALARAGDEPDRPTVERLMAALVGRFADLSGGQPAVDWLAPQWPADAHPEHFAITAHLAVASVSSACRCAEVYGADPVVPGAFDTACEEVRRLASWLLDRAGVATAPNLAGRVVRLLSELDLPAATVAGEHRFHRWERALVSPRSLRSVHATLAAFAGWHAAHLCSFVASFDRIRERDHAVERRIAPSLLPDDEAERQSLTPAAREMLARASVVFGSLAADAGAHEQALGHLARARAYAPGNPLFSRIANEARFRAHAWTAELAEELRKEAHREGTLAAAAELLGVAREIGSPALVRLARRWVRERSDGEHVWMARAQALFADPAGFSDPARVAALRGGSAPPDPDPAERLVYALYGEDPPATVGWVERTLEVQQEVLEWEVLVRELGPDDRAPASLPWPSVAPSPEAAASAITALQDRIERLTRRDVQVRQRLGAHVERARELAAAEDAAASAPWLCTVADREGGLLAALDAHLSRQGDRIDTRGQIELALARGADALESALLAVWCSMFFQRLAALWPLAAISSEGPRLRREAAELLREATAAVDGATRVALDDRLSRLLERAARDAAPYGAGSAEHEGSDDGSADDRFIPMTFSDRAIERSVRELATPPWGIQDGLRQVGYFNLSRGRRDIKMLRGTRDDGGALWELRGHARHPVRVMYRLTSSGPLVLAIFIKGNDEQQRRVIDQVLAWTA